MQWVQRHGFVSNLTLLMDALGFPLSRVSTHVYAGAVGGVWPVAQALHAMVVSLGADAPQEQLNHSVNNSYALASVSWCIVYMQAQLEQCGQLIQDAQWDSLRLILPRIKKNPTNAGGVVVARKAAIVTMEMRGEYVCCVCPSVRHV